MEYLITYFRNIYTSQKKNDNENVCDRICHFLKVHKENIRKKDYEKLLNLSGIDVYNFNQVWKQIVHGENEKFIILNSNGDELVLHREGWVLQKFRLVLFFNLVKTFLLFFIATIYFSGLTHSD